MRQWKCWVVPSSARRWNGSGSDSHGSPLFHLLTGASMLGAFFIATEPVSGP
ncbi:RnfABCDGE type electron transport complex subunit D [Pseudomonas sp. GG8]